MIEDIWEIWDIWEVRTGVSFRKLTFTEKILILAVFILVVTSTVNFIRLFMG